MIHLIAKYNVEGTVASDMKSLLAYLKPLKTIYIDTEGEKIGRSPIKMDIHDFKVTMLQIGDQ